MNKCPITEETFEPKNPDQVFLNKEAFNEFIKEMDPLENFEINKRKIGWEPAERLCRDCNTPFIAHHPAMHYCELHRAAPTTPEETHEDGDRRRLAPKEYYKPREKECVNCESIFLSTTPAMRYCENCSIKGGKLIKTT
jgi:Zn finger protein HypA/HybF involved in hydrogenase expression